jgi:hypothetical protein
MIRETGFPQCGPPRAFRYTNPDYHYSPGESYFFIFLATPPGNASRETPRLGSLKKISISRAISDNIGMKPLYEIDELGRIDCCIVIMPLDAYARH